MVTELIRVGSIEKGPCPMSSDPNHTINFERMNSNSKGLIEKGPRPVCSSPDHNTLQVPNPKHPKSNHKRPIEKGPCPVSSGPDLYVQPIAAPIDLVSVEKGPIEKGPRPVCLGPDSVSAQNPKKGRGGTPVIFSPSETSAPILSKQPPIKRDKSKKQTTPLETLDVAPADRPKEADTNPTNPKSAGLSEGKPPHLFPPDFYTLTPQTFAEVCDRTGFTFTADLNGFSASNLPDFISADKYTDLQKTLSADLTGKTSLIYSTREKTRLILQYYNSIKAVEKEKIKAACLVPSTDVNRLQNELRGWSMIYKLPKRSYTINKHWQNYPQKEVLGAVDLLLYVDSKSTIAKETTPTPVVTYQLRSQKLSMSFDGKISGAKAMVGTDTFAEGPGYIHPSFVQQNRLHTRPCVAKVLLADGVTEVTCEEECLTHVHIGGYSSKAWLMVLPLPEPYDVILGDEWLRSHGARLLFDKQMMEVITPKRRYAIKTIHAPKPTSYTRVSKSEPRLLNYSQVRRASNKGHQMILCFVQKEHKLSDVEGKDVNDISHPDLQQQHKSHLQQLLDRYKGIFWHSTLHRSGAKRGHA
jgi:hypothetical protein